MQDVIKIGSLTSDDHFQRSLKLPARPIGRISGIFPYAPFSTFAEFKHDLVAFMYKICDITVFQNANLSVYLKSFSPNVPC